MRRVRKIMGILFPEESVSVSPTFRQLDRRKQNRILSAATTEFARAGYSGASINTIVEKLGISKGSIFNYFTDKHGLFMFVFGKALDQVKAYLRRVRDESADDDLFTRVEKSLLAGVDFVRSHPRIYRIYVRLLYDGDLPNRTALVKEIRLLSIEYLTEFLTVAKDRGEIRPDIDIKAAAFLLEAVLERFLQAFGLQHLDAGMGLFKADEEEIKRWAKEVVTLLKSGFPASSAK